MDDDEEEYYDSLDEETSFEPARLNLPRDSEFGDFESSQLNLPPDNETCFISSQNEIYIAPEYIELEEKLVVRKKSHSTKIPLYVGEIDKEDLITKICTKKKSSHTCLAGENSIKHKIKIDNPLKKKSENSYWSLYCQKNKLPNTTPADEEEKNPLKSFYGSSRTFSALVNSSSCLTGSTWDAPSMFEKYMPKTYASPRSDPFSFDEEDIDRSTSRSTRLSHSLDISLDNLKSLSQADLHSKPSRSSKASKSKSNISNTSFRLLKCGPDSEKLELIRKKQEYGTRVSSRNRARIIQNLTKLKHELEDDRKKGISQ